MSKAETTMVRKQIYVKQAHEQKIRELASVRRCSEAEVIREAIDLLPEPPRRLESLLESLGVRNMTEAEVEAFAGKSIAEVRSNAVEWTKRNQGGFGLGEELDRDRQDRI